MVARQASALLGLVLIAAAAIYASVEAAALVAGTENYVEDGFCFQGEEPNYGLAAAAVPGVGLAVWAIVSGIRRLRGRSVSSAMVLVLTAVSCLWLLGWSAALLGSNIGFADDTQPLPAIQCTYEDPPFSGII